MLSETCRRRPCAIAQAVKMRYTHGVVKSYSNEKTASPNKEISAIGLFPLLKYCWSNRKRKKAPPQVAMQKCKSSHRAKHDFVQKVIEHEGETFTTSGRGSRPGTQFTYTVSRSGGAGGRHYEGVSVDGYGNELWVTTNPNSPDAQKLKQTSVSGTIKFQ